MLVLVVGLASGCSAAGGSASPGRSGGSGGSVGEGGSIGGGGIAFVNDAGTNPRPDASVGEPVQPNLSPNPPVFGSDAGLCTSCTGGRGGSGNGGSLGAGGSVGSGGRPGGSTAAGTGGASRNGGFSSPGGATTVGGFASQGGALGTGGVSASGGVTGRGGSTGGVGGALPVDAGPPPSDASARLDASAVDQSRRDTGVDVDAGLQPDAQIGPNDLRPADGSPADTTPSRCVAQIQAVIPVTDSFADPSFHMAAGANVQVVLRASVVSGGPPGVNWLWQASQNGTPLTPVLGKQDPAAAAFPIVSDGDYSFTAFDKTGACSVTIVTHATVANTCGPPCDDGVSLRAAPPPTSDPTTDFPVQSGWIDIVGSSPFSQTNIVLSHGVAVQVAPKVGTNLVMSYVRVNQTDGGLIVDGLADPQAGGFFAQLLAKVPHTADPLAYDVLVVPLDGSNGETVAPQLYQNLTPNSINQTAFNLAGGVGVTGKTVSSTGPVSDVRVMLTNQDPAAAHQSKLIFSSVGRSDAQGNYLLHAQPGNYWVSLSPPNGSGLSDVLSPSSVSLTGETTIGFQWATVSTSTLVLNVLDANGSPSPRTRVRLTSAQPNAVGNLTVGSGSPILANGNVQIESLTSTSGSVTFANLPDGVGYDVLLVPDALGAYSATTELSIAVAQGGGTQSVSLVAQARINGQLVVGSTDTIDWSLVKVSAYDRSTDTPETPLIAGVYSDGTFSLPVSPGRPYSLLVAPDPSTGFARTFVFPGLVQASEFVLTQNVPRAMAWSSTVIDSSQVGVSGTALQVFCVAGWPGCVDPTVPIADTTSGDGGTFQLALPGPASR
jgi:hypothetical protein